MSTNVRSPRVGAKRAVRDLGKRWTRQGFELVQRLGVNVLPAHYYSMVPDMRSLAASTSWKQPHSLAGVQGAGDIDGQLAILESWLSAGPSQPTWRQACDEHGEPGYGPVESDVLYAFVGTVQPKRIIQIGAGVSTSVILRSAREAGYVPEITCIDPFPTKYLVERAERDAIELRAEPAQEVDINFFDDLRDGDLLFIDSTHTVKPGSEVNRIVFEILPRLSPGVWVHFHDITFPYDYSRGLLTNDLFFWGESTLVLAFLVGNSRFAVKVSMSMLHYGRTDDLRSMLPHYVPQQNDGGLRASSEGHFPSSTYLRVLDS